MIEELKKEIFSKYGIGKKVKIISEKFLNDEDVIERLSILTDGFSGRDIKKLIDVAINKAIISEKEINYQLMWESLEEFLIGKEKKTDMSQDELKRIAYHELGHAVIGKHFGKTIHQISIASKNMSLGQTFSTKLTHELLPVSENFLEDVYELLGGRAAEKIYMGNISAGSANDYESVTNNLLRYLTLNFRYEVDKNNLKTINNELGLNLTKNDTIIKLGFVIDDIRHIPSKMRDKLFKDLSIIVCDCEIKAESLLYEYKKTFEEYGDLLVEKKAIFEDEFKLIK